MAISSISIYFGIPFNIFKDESKQSHEGKLLNYQFNKTINRIN